MKKKFLLTFTAMMLSIFALGAVNVSAAKYGDLTYTVSNGEVTITDCSTSVKSVTIPEKIDGYPVTKIGENAFYNCKNFTSIEIPGCLTEIGSYAFDSCSNLWSIEIPDGVTKIGSYAFDSCTNLRSVKISDSVTMIGYAAFYNCSNLTSVHIKDIGAWCNIKFGGYSANPMEYANNLYINGVIPTELIIPEGVTAIPDYAFKGCSSLTSIEIPDSVTTIGSYAFYNTGYYNDSNNWENGVLYINNALIGANTDISGSYTIKPRTKVIADNAFYNCINLAGVEIPDNVTTIGASAFSGCGSLTSIEIPDSVTAIGAAAFYGCGSLTSIEIPDGVTSIGVNTFYNCSSLTSIEIPDGVTSIGSSACYGCSGITSITIPSVGYLGYIFGASSYKNNSNYVPSSLKEVVITGGSAISSDTFYNCRNLTSIEIPDSVTAIGSSAFYGCSSLTSIEIPDSVTSIGSYAFEYCSNLARVIIGNGVASIGSSAFYGCSSLTSIEIPDSVTSIGSSAFYDCSSLISIEIPDSVTKVGLYAFEDCTNLTDVYITDLESWCNIEFGSYDASPLYYADNLYINGVLATDVVIPDGVTGIQPCAFSCDSLTSIKIPDSVTSIGSYAFYNCCNLTSIEIPDNVTTIGASAFLGCSGFISIEIPDSVTEIGKGAFSGCDSLTNITIPFVGGTESDSKCFGYIFGASEYSYNPEYVPDSLREVIITGGSAIPSRAFFRCKGLTSIKIPDSVTKVGLYAFEDCTNLTDVYVTDIESWCNIVFETGYYSEAYSSNPMHYADRLYINGKRAVNVVIPDGVTRIPVYAFHGCDSIKSITIPDSVTAIDTDAFYECTNLTDVYITDIESWCNIEFGSSLANPLGYADNLYINGVPATDVVIPDGVTKIPTYAFSCDSLISIEIPNSVTSIGEYAFSGCSLTSIKIPDSVTTICDHAFCGCDSLTSIGIPDGVIEIGMSAFYDCDSLTNIEIPDSVTTIGVWAFEYCRSLTSVTIGNGVTTWGGSAFSGCSSLSKVTFKEGTERLDVEPIQSMTALKTITIPKSVTEIEPNTFSYCSKLKTVIYPGSESEWNEMYIGAGNDYLKNANIIYDAKEKIYKFVTNTDKTLPDITDYYLSSAPVITAENKTFLGWYDNSALTGTPVTFPYYGSATTLYAGWTDKTGLSFDDAFTADSNKKYTIATTQTGQMVYYEFVPRLTGEYRFYTTGSKDTIGYLYNSSKSQITSDDDDGEGSNFYISYNLTAGNTYYIAMKLYSGTGSFTFVTETDCVESTTTVCIVSSDGRKIFKTIPNYLPLDSQIILACYKDGKFVEIKSALNKNETIYFIADDDFDTAKVMAWDSFGNMKPLCEAEIVEH